MATKLGTILLAAFLPALGGLTLASCTPMSNRPYVERYPEYRGIRRVAVFLQRWPVYSKLKGEGVTELDFIQKDTPFLNALEPAERLDPRAVDVKDIDDGLMGQLLLEAFRYKGYDPFLAEIASSDQETVAGIMARYLDIAPRVDGFLFCFYSPTLYFSRAEKVPPDHRFRSYYLQEIAHLLNPGGDRVIWAGPRAGRALPNSITHAFIYLAMSLFNARDFRMLWAVAGSQTGGRLRVLLWDCPPEPTEEDYWADVKTIRRLMVNNLRCRLRHLIPDAF
uniref:Lipoprotein n=1 Tax=Desulfobacca acetoxidans TaxID=60893 RepID=A0A7C3WJ60_9BACT